MLRFLFIAVTLLSDPIAIGGESEGRPADAKAPASCAVTGLVQLTREGAPLDPENGVVIYLAGNIPGTHPDPKPYTINQEGHQFVPAIQVVVQRSTIEFTNKDKDSHSVFSHSHGNFFELPVSMGGVTGKWTFLSPGHARIQCDIHEWMRADVLVVPNRFFTLVGKGGRFRLGGLAPGDHTLVAWEPNGNKVEFEVRGCQGELAAQVPELKQARWTRLLNKNYQTYDERTQYGHPSH